MRTTQKIVISTITVITINILFLIRPNIFFTPISANTRNPAANVGVLLFNLEDPFIIQLKQDLENIQKENPGKVKYTVYDGKDNISIQLETLDSLLKNNVDLLIVNLADKSESVVEDIINRVKPKNIPIILADIDPSTVSKASKLYDKAVFVSPDFSLGGVAQGKILINLWNKDKEAIDKNGDNILQYILLQGKANDIISTERSHSVISTINAAGIKTELLQSVNADWSKELAEDTVSSLLLKYNNEIEAIISNNDTMAIGAVQALQKYGFNIGNNSKYIPVVGIDAFPEAKNLVDKGFMAGTVSQDVKPFADAYYIIGNNLLNDLNPIENTTYTYSNGVIIVPITYNEYTKK